MKATTTMLPFFSSSSSSSRPCQTDHNKQNEDDTLFKSKRWRRSLNLTDKELSRNNSVRLCDVFFGEKR